jgi:antitoxin VapB
MPLNIKNEEAHRLARELAGLTHCSITEAVTAALREALEKRKSLYERRSASLADDLLHIAEHTDSLTVYDDRAADAILGYDDEGVPG